jgi:hypothetical protein
MGTILPLYSLLIDEPEVRFVNQGRGLQRVTGMLAPHVSRSDAP